MYALYQSIANGENWNRARGAQLQQNPDHKSQQRKGCLSGAKQIQGFGAGSLRQPQDHFSPSSGASSARRSLPQSLRRGIESTGCIACDPRCTARWVSQQCPAHPPGIGRTQRTPLRSSSSLPGSTLSSVRLFSHWLSLVIPFVPPGNALAASG